ncbi:MAG TPA: DUF1343 domain-containing protein [Roseiflexaceae bacterium]|nr:DUF1343 domain-containing protein [Roseiflexaceae bacterium]
MFQTGLDILLRERADLVRGRRVGLVAHSAAVAHDLTWGPIVLLRAGVRLVALFDTEQGLSGAAAIGTSETHKTDVRTGLPLHELYQLSYEPSAAMLNAIDVLLFDMQDVGARFYTPLNALYAVLRGAARARTPVVVLDRPNPITGLTLEGPLVEPGYESSIGTVALPIRHGLTIGEAALFMNEVCGLGAALTVVEMRGWRRDLWFDQLGRLWVLPSSALPHLSTAAVYPGMCLLEGTNLAHGRGTALPFELCGAPWVDGDALAERLNSLRLPGVSFRALRFVPQTSLFAGQACGGIQVHVTDRALFQAVAVGLHVITTIRELYPGEFSWHTNHFDLLMGSTRTREAVEAGVPVGEIVESWRDALARYEQQRAAVLRYP